MQRPIPPAETEITLTRFFLATRGRIIPRKGERSEQEVSHTPGRKNIATFDSHCVLQWRMIILEERLLPRRCSVAKRRGLVIYRRLLVRACKHKNLVIHINTHTWGQVSRYECLLARYSRDRRALRVAFLRSSADGTDLDERVSVRDFSRAGPSANRSISSDV